MTKVVVTSQEQLFSCPVFDVVKEQVQLEDGRIFKHITAQHPGAVVVIAANRDGELLLIKQYRHSVSDTILEFPAGTLNPGEDPLECARRELAEETGYNARNWVELGELLPAPGFCNERQYCFFATDLFEQSARADEDEVIELIPSSVKSVEAAIRAGEMQDGKSIAIFFRAKLLGHLPQ